jgi:hypothetical protein
VRQVGEAHGPEGVTEDEQVRRSFECQVRNFLEEVPIARGQF